MNLTRLLQTSAAVVLAVASVGTPLRTNADDPLEIPAIVSTTGPAAFIGKTITTSIGLIEQQVNASGGINGRQVKFRILDDQSRAQVAVQLASELIAHKTPVILGPVTAAACDAVAPLAKNGPVFYCFSSAIAPPSGSYMFAAHPSSHDLLAAAAGFLRSKGWTKIAYMTSTDAAGKLDETDFNDIFRGPKSPFDVVSNEHMAGADISVAAQVARMKASGAQAIVAWVVGTPFGTLLHGISDSGLDLPVITTGANLSQTQMNTYASFLPKQLYVTGFPAFAEDQLPRGRVKDATLRFLQAMKAANVPIEVGNEASWDPTELVVESYKKFGFGVTAEQIRNYIANLSGWAGVVGMYDFKRVPQRGVDISNLLILQWRPDQHGWTAVTRLR